MEFRYGDMFGSEFYKLVECRIRLYVSSKKNSEQT